MRSYDVEKALGARSRPHSGALRGGRRHRVSSHSHECAGALPFHNPTATQEPKLTLKVVRRGPHLDDLVVTAKLESPVPVGLYLRQDTPVAYLGIRRERWSWISPPRFLPRTGTRII